MNKATINNMFFENKELKKHIEEQLETQLNKAALIIIQHADGSISKIHSAKRGNRSYANLTQDRMDNGSRQLKKLVDEKGGSLLAMTLTAEYDPTDIGDIENSYIRIKEGLLQIHQWLRRNGFDEYIEGIEAHFLGGCHSHLIIHHKEKLETVLDKGRITRLADKTLEQIIKAAWQRCFNGRRAKVDIQVIDDLDGAAAYLSKELGRESHIESALKRFKRDWTGKDDEDYKKQDIKKLLGWYFANKLKIRRWNMSRGLKVAALDKDIIVNSIGITTEDKKDKVTDWFIIPKSDMKKGLFTGKPGRIKKNTPEYERAMYYFAKHPNEHKLSREKLRLMILKRLNEKRKNKLKLLITEAMTAA
jgi:hypothetical protein